MLSTYDVIEGARVPGRPNLYVLGCYDSRITFYSQQVRALQLAHALHEQHYLPPNARIAVVGGGAGGVTLAAALALTADVRAMVFERSDELLPLQRGSTRRRIDPHIYDWPKEDAEHEFAELPILDWRSGPANEVREAVLREFGEIKAEVGPRIDILLRHNVRSIAPAGDGYEISFEREPNALDVAGGEDRGTGCTRVDLVILAFGFGLEPLRPLPNTNTESYWSDAGVPGPEITGKARPRFFVSGNGDGGLIDLIAAASADFSHAETIRAIVRQAGVREIAERLKSIDLEARRADAEGTEFDFITAYNSQIAQDVARLGLIDVMSRRLRPGVQLTFQTRDAGLMSVKTSTLNRLAVYLVIKACEQDAAANFQHIACPEVTSVEPPDDREGADYMFNCGGTLVPADKVIIRRGPSREDARRPFENILEGFAEHHEAWLKRLAEHNIVPILSDPARAHFVRKCQEHNISLPRYLRPVMVEQVPLRVKLQPVGDRIRWTGSFTLAEASRAWDRATTPIHIICQATPEELGPAALALARLVIHAEQTILFANVSAWRPLLEKITTASSHAEDLGLPVLRAVGAEGAILNPEVMTPVMLRSRLNFGMDRWVLSAINSHLQGYLASGLDPGHKVAFKAAPALREQMLEVWDEWRGSLEVDAELLGRFLRLTLCAVDTEELIGEAHALVGPQKMKGLIRATAVALAVATAWKAMTPHAARPGNLSRALGENQIQTGHACAADLIDGELMALSAASFIWRTHFVVLPMINRPSGFSALSDASLVKTEGGPPRLTEAEDQANIVLSLDEAFVSAVRVGPGALVELLARVEEIHFRRLANAIERAAV